MESFIRRPFLFRAEGSFYCRKVEDIIFVHVFFYIQGTFCNHLASHDFYSVSVVYLQR